MIWAAVRRVWTVPVLLILVLAAVRWSGSAMGPAVEQSSQPLVDEAGEAAGSREAAREAAERRLSAPLGRGGSLYGALQAAGLGAGEAQPFADALGEVAELRRLAAGDTVTVAFGAAGGAPRRVTIAHGPELRYEAVRQQGAITARRITVPVERRVRRLTGTVETSLYLAVLAAGGDPEVVARVADLLAWDIDFFTDPRPGDRFDILLEERWLAGGRRLGGEQILLVSYQGRLASQSACRFEPAGGRETYFDAGGKSLRKALLKSPLHYRRITSTFSHRRLHPITRTYRPHLGVDFAAPVGTPVVAVGDGTVQLASRKGANGKLVIVQHPNGYETFYLHLSRFGRGVRRGARVKQGQVIGYVGATGAATGPHLDFRVKHHGRFVNPLKLTLPPGLPVPAEELSAFRDTRQRYAALRAALAPGERVAAGGAGGAPDGAERLGGFLEQRALAASSGVLLAATR